MEISKNSWLSYIERLARLDKTAAAKMKAYVQKNGFSDIEALIDYAYGIATKYGEGSAALAAEMYDAIAELSGVLVPPAEVAATATYGEVAKAVNGTAKYNNVELVSNAVGRLVKRAGVDTTMKNAIRDGAQWAWIPHGDTCAFCLTLASRGWQKASKAALKGDHASHIHAHCDCTYAIRFNGDTQYAGYDPDKYLEMYENAEGGTSKDKINSLRRAYYQQNKDKINAQKRAAYAEKKALSGNDNGDIIKSKKLMEYLNKPIEKTDNQSIREWYVANVSDIPNQIDKTGSLEEQARQAFELRNNYKHEARVAMSDEKGAAKLERVFPAPEWEDLIKDKMKRKTLTREEAIKDILESASKTNNDVNKEFGL